MKRFSVTIALCAGLASAPAGQMPMPKYGVKVTADKHVDYAKFKTYSWTPGQPSADKRIDARVVAAVDRELGALGMTKATSGPVDVLVTYYSLSRTDVNVKAKPDAEGRFPQYWVGSLVVALLDPDSQQQLLRLRIDEPIDIEPAKLDATIDAAAAALFAKYPTRRRK
jgi:Domain of unknown function (DUF4136)